MRRAVRSLARIAAGALGLLGLSACPDTDLPGGQFSGTNVCTESDRAAFRAASDPGVGTREDLWVAFIDVGQGDAIWIRTPGEREASAREILIDAGDNGSFSRSEGGEAVIDFMSENGFPPGSPIDYLVVSNPDQDHYGGVEDLLFGPDAYDVRAYSDTGRDTGGEGYENFLARVLATPGLEVLRPARTTLTPEVFGRWSNGLVRVTLLAADENAADNNAASIVMRVDFAGIRLLLTGDADEDVLEALAAARPADMRAHVYKVAHHGSKNNTSEAIVEAVFPTGDASPDRYAVVSVGAGNTYGHPDPGVLEALQTAVGLRGVYRTDRGDTGKRLTESPGDDHVLMHVTSDGRLTVCYAYPDTPAPASSASP